MLLFLGLLALFCLVPDHAFAWGPATHLEYGLSALAQLSLFLPWIRALLEAHPNDFLYGTVAADITLGKKYTHYTRNCHNWQVALDILDGADKDHQKAFMLGYLSHLAADTVSHNFFVPYFSLQSFRATSLRHTYWEMRMEAHASEDAIHLVENFQDEHHLENDKLLEQELAKTLFSFKTNKRIFNALLNLQRSEHFRKLTQTMSETSQWQLSAQEAVFFKELCMNAVLDFLANYTQAECLKADPTGQHKIGYGREQSKKLKCYDRDGHVDSGVERRFFSDLKGAMAEGLYQPILLPVIEDYL